MPGGGTASSAKYLRGSKSSIASMDDLSTSPEMKGRSMSWAPSYVADEDVPPTWAMSTCLASFVAVCVIVCVVDENCCTTSHWGIVLASCASHHVAMIALDVLFERPVCLQPSRKSF